METSDAVLLAGVRRADVGALRELYRRHGAVVHGSATVVARRGSSHPDDLTVAAFVALFRSPPVEDAVLPALLRAVARYARRSTLNPTTDTTSRWTSAPVLGTRLASQAVGSSGSTS